ncbi:peptidyl-prolyl cis-trans isomerase [Ramlibacter ginsenosidimutans]|uniref:peptidylprolyl isomerase n=1 Tax=Ramlibacter ginsenosidimutans TaxID=502333 RepID=A0A934TNV1_9BURK|nr:peptidylprolyl isomerase [Ramlibacter ginsenosidimutans]MBK6004769.1 peptidyl-prolyl cis-trans isomerase [Ramlibacter ginsenosidimutans]
MKSILGEPLLHFVAIGAALFVWFQWSGGGAGPGSTRIAITSGQIQHLAASYTKAWQHPPTDTELKGLIDDWVREEIAVREAVAAGLDRDDTIVRRRLRQKLEFLAEEAAQAAPPTDQELEAWLTSHGDALRIEPRVAFRQVFVSRERRGAAAERDAAAILARLNAIGPAAPVDALGDPTMLPSDIELTSTRDIDRLFGPGFAQRIETLAPGAWVGPVKSSYGLHLVQVRARTEGALPQLAAVRPLVEREVLAERRNRQLDAMYEQLLAKYKVVIEPHAPAAADQGRP